MKKNWRKHTDITDVEDYLEEKRLEERTGGVRAEKRDDQLFFLDKPKPALIPAPASKGSLKKRKIDEPLKCYANLQVDDGVPSPDTMQSGEKGKKKKKRLPPAIKRQTDPKLIKRLRASQKQHAINEKRKAQKKAEEEDGIVATKDLWASDEEMKDDDDDDDDPLAFHNKITKVTRVAVPNSRDAMKRQASQVPAVVVPHPGASYNPDLKHFLNHLNIANAVEEKKVAEEAKLNRELDAKFPDQEEAKHLESNWLKEMSGGLGQEKEMEETEEQKVEEKRPEQKKEKRKTKKQKRKAREQRTIKQKLAKKKTAKQRELEFGKLKSINKEISTQEAEMAERLKKRVVMEEKKATSTRRLGHNKYEAMDIEVKLSNELVGDMRSLVPEGNLLEDRYDNLKKRNMVAPGVRQKKGQRKFKRKKQEKRAWRGVTLDDVDVPIATV